MRQHDHIFRPQSFFYIALLLYSSLLLYQDRRHRDLNIFEFFPSLEALRCREAIQLSHIMLERAHVDCTNCLYNCKNCNCRELSLSLSADNACVWLGPFLQKTVNLLSGKSSAVWGGDRVYSVHCKCIKKMQVYMFDRMYLK